MPLVSEVLERLPANDPPVTEANLDTSCPQCGAEQSLDEASVATAEDGLETVYTCREGCGPILIVATPGVVSWEGRGYRIGVWVIRNPRDLFMRLRNGKSICFDASPHALD